MFHTRTDGTEGSVMARHDTSKTAADRLVTLAGLAKGEAEDLVEAALQAAEDQTLETITGAGPLPSSMTATRAQQLHYVCLNAKRILTEREVEVLFRATPAQARTIMTTMYATYEQALRGHFRDQMIEDAAVTASGTEGTELTWTIRFTERSSYEFTLDELNRLGLDRWATTSASRLTIVLPRSADKADGESDSLKVLGLPRP
jgi:hypothetical protein